MKAVDFNQKPPIAKAAPPPEMDAGDDSVPASERMRRGVSAPRILSPRIGDILDASLVRVDRRGSGVEKPIALPWSTLAPHFGGGLWPGLHILNSGTGVGKTQFVLGVAAFAARAGVPVLYVGLELGELDLALRLLGGEAKIPWSHLWTGTAGPAYLARAREAADRLRDLPFHYEVSRPFGFAVSDLRAVVETVRAQYPETNGPGSRPLLAIVDFLQLVGDEKDQRPSELRERIGQVSYALRDFASRLNIAVLAISSVARDRYSLINELHTTAKLAWDEDEDGCPINRRILNTDAIVGAGKESGELEYSADSVTIVGKVPATWDGHGVDVIIATAKGRATGAMWSPLHFTGFAFLECSDRGGRILEAWKETSERRAAAREEKLAAKEAEKLSRAQTDAETVRAYVAAHSGCSVREARLCVADNGPRWVAAVAVLGEGLIQTRPAKRTEPVRLSVADGEPIR